MQSAPKVIALMKASASNASLILAQIVMKHPVGATYARLGFIWMRQEAASLAQPPVWNAAARTSAQNVTQGSTNYLIHWTGNACAISI